MARMQFLIGTSNDGILRCTRHHDLDTSGWDDLLVDNDDEEPLGIAGECAHWRDGMEVENNRFSKSLCAVPHEKPANDRVMSLGSVDRERN
jgi:hypothetical protein